MEGLQAMECHKFTGPDEKERYNNIFRYLDPGGEGSVSTDEWQILGQLWKEFVLTIEEFVQFLIFAFGEDLQNAWERMDEDGGGEISEEEFYEICEKIGYFGPGRVVFALLDSSDDGNISWDEFEVLNTYKPGAKPEKRVEVKRASKEKASNLGISQDELSELQRQYSEGGSKEGSRPSSKASSKRGSVSSKKN
eukprot:TRINITY_DN39564_c0_g2_i1.p1 TRINITY_DN39564_c0_g2~~TRINITY_DN39564_c0_g2_i1.p1  ORF type:complete len:194 (-),score=45.12 TRINITY_DN39564_c0_g2_i1:75-656(-)